MRTLKAIALIALTIVGVLASLGTAQAGPTDSWVYRSTFGEELNTTLNNIAVNAQSGNVLVMGGDGSVHQFDAAGKPTNFTAIGSPSIAVSGSRITIDSSGPDAGDFFITDGTTIHSFKADGTAIGSYEPMAEGLFGELFFFGPVTVFTAPDGTIYVTCQALFAHEFTYYNEIVAVTPEMKATGPRYEIGETQIGYLPPVLDGLGTLYAPQNYGTLFKFDATNKYAFVENASGGTGAYENQVTRDPSNNDIYRVSEEFTFDPSAPPNGYVNAILPGSKSTTPATPVLTAAGGLHGGGGIGINAAGDRMYVSEGKHVRLFQNEGPIAPWNIGAPQAKEIRAYGAVLQSSLIDGNATTTYKFEYGLTSAYGNVSETFTAPHKYFSQVAGGPVAGLEQDTTYHFRIVATNSVGTTYGADGTFKTYPIAAGADPCPNALARKQTVASRLPDCRAYELASAPDTGGYDVESYLAPGQEPFGGYPDAKDKLLYATHSGAVPGPWKATNKGRDPYVATRTEDGWVTQYEGLPSDLNEAAGSFSSALGEADASLDTLAFAGSGLCSPCFETGLETGIPVRLPNGQLTQGMSGSLAGSVPDTARPEGKVAKYFSADGKHLVFASKYAFEPGANETGTDLTVYDRDLSTGTTQIVSTDQNGDVLKGQPSELGISSDGSRIVTGAKVSVDSSGSEYVHPYMHIGSSPDAVDLAPGTTSGVLFAGMTADGSRVFFTTPDKLAAGDTDSSADLYEAAVDGSGELTLSTVAAENSDGCNPVSNSAGKHWNSIGSAANCDAVAISGGGGVASASGAVYFLSPEQLDGSGTLNQPNLYRSDPDGSFSFVATLEPDNPLVLDSVADRAARRTADFQVNPSGEFAAFTSKLDLTELHTGGFYGAYLYDAGAELLDCVSCDLTGTDEAGAFGDAELPPDGLALLDDGRLLFTTTAQLLLNDANGKKDVYEWVGGKQRLISAGSGPFDSALLSASADGTDVFFFTHDALASEEDHNGALMRIYDAREFGGFFKLPPAVPCQASDECHGPSSPQPPPSDIKSSGGTTPGNVVVCPKNRVKKHNTCVKKPHAKKKKRHGKKHHHRKGHSNA